MSATWDVRRSGPTESAHRALLIPGGMCTTEFYADLMAEKALADLALVAVTQPGFGPTTPPDDVSMENYARLLADVAARERCDLVVGHSLGANVALEMAALGLFTGPLVLLSPTFSRGDESTFLTVLDAVGRVPLLGPLAWAGMLKVVPRAMRGSLPPHRAETLSRVMADNDAAVCRRMVREYYAYLARYPSLVPRLCEAGVPTWVVRGEHDEIGLTGGERRGLEACPHVTLVTVPDASHLLLVQKPARIADVVLEAAAATR
ncbi:alpha/beta fold hydrolase [Streptomyces sp. Ru71]|uniref:alpha/beta fold hydrolase n=1 Tax=Streptomyces sp. Ru71 TaxID=2080746 RepID=UPI0015E454CD|nr:alpha/beta hydrolase [Streptomyces sp. Ru71]